MTIKVKEALWPTFQNLGLFIFGMYFAGFVISRLWNWYVAPLGVLELTTIMGIGIQVLFAALKGPDHVLLKMSEKDLSLRTSAAYHSLSYDAVCLFVGWVFYISR